MKKIKRLLKIFGFISLIALALAGVGLPIPLFLKDRFANKPFHQEQVDEAREDDDQSELSLEQ